VLRTHTELKVGIRLPPNAPHKKCLESLKELLTKDVPHNCKVTLSGLQSGTGWCMKEYKPWVTKALNEASTHFFNKKCESYGCGGSIPFLG